MTTETGSFSFAIQKEKGCFTTPDTWLPTLAVEDPLGLRKSYQTYSAQGGHVNRYNETGKWAEGNLLIPLTPASWRTCCRGYRPRQQQPGQVGFAAR